jgi:hypothetical protein
MITLPDFDKGLVIQAIEREIKALRDAIAICHTAGHSTEVVQIIEARIEDYNCLRLLFQISDLKAKVKAKAKEAA